MNKTKKYGVFINHRHDNRHLAGRIYDFFSSKGMNPFLDIYSLHQGRYKDDIIEIIEQSPYFLCVLTPGSLDNLNPDDPEAMYYQELEAAFTSEATKVLVVTLGEFNVPKSLPDKIKGLAGCHYYTLTKDMSNFYSVMEQLYSQDISQKTLIDLLDWKDRCTARSGTFLAARTVIESELATLENRFGRELIEAVKSGNEFTGEQKIKQIRMSCYAASIIFTPQRDMLDHYAYDRGLLFNIFAQLLRDPDFSLEIIINAPSSCAVNDAVDNMKLGNSSLESCPEAVFYGSYAGVTALKEHDSIFAQAVKEKRFRFMVTENVLSYALFQIIYKDAWKEYNHIKVDLYSEGINSSMERRCMIIFEESDKDNYSFFEARYNYIRNVRKSKNLIAAHNDEWLAEWEEIKDE